MLKTKFEAIDPEVIEYEEDIHGPTPEEMAAADGKEAEFEKMSTSSSAETSGSVEEEDSVEKK
jgi:hypothetical protein